ncbi:MAG: MFS transporter, partial [Brevundimonas sp.]|nr:MFS transporter [Brevundimonas sp.]
MKASNTRYTVVGYAVALAVIMYIQRVAIGQAAPEIRADLGLDQAQMGQILGAFAISYALFEIPGGLLGDKIGPRRMLSQIVVGWSIFTALTGAAWNYASLWVIRFLFGAGEAGCFPNLTKMLSVWLPKGERVRAQALMWASTRWGGAITPLLAVTIISFVGWRWAFVIFGLLGVLWVASFLPWFKDDPAQHKGVNAEELKLLEGARAIAHSKSGGGWKVLFTPQVLVLIGQYFFFSFVWYFYVTWLPSWLREAHALPREVAAMYAFVPLFFGGVGSLTSGFLPIGVNRRVVAFCAMTATAILLFCVTRASSPIVAIALLGAASFTADLCMPISWNACVEIGRRSTATVAGAMNMLGNLSGFVAPVLGGYILKG